MSDIHHYHAGQFFTFKTQIGLKLFLFQLDNLLLLPFKLCLMDYTLLLNHTVLLFLHKAINNILQQGQQAQPYQNVASHSPIRQIPRRQNLKGKLHRCQNSTSIIYLRPKNITSIRKTSILFLQIASIGYPLIRIPFQPVSYFISIIVINRIAQCKTHCIKLMFDLDSRLHDQCLPFITEFLSNLHL